MADVCIKIVLGGRCNPIYNSGSGGSSIIVVDNLTSTSKKEALSANQGRVLLELWKSLLDRIEIVEVIESDKNYKHTQTVPESLWTVNHNLNKFPSVTVIDSANTEVIGEIVYVNENTINILFSSEFSGTVICN